MLIRMSRMFGRTLREDPADAEVRSHALLVRAGYVRRAAAGGYTLLPLGKIAIDRIAAIIREEMDAIGGQEILFPSLLPREPYERSGRWSEYGPDMLRVIDRRGSANLLAPTHEEMFALLVADIATSYRDLPVILYQVGTKFRDEPRARAGLLRLREFTMKDAYSFDLDEDGLRAAYVTVRGAYERIFARLGIAYTIVSAVAGAMGGSFSEEFLATAEAGEDAFAACPACGYAANTEAVAVPVPAVAAPATAPLEVLDTPGTPTIESLVRVINDRAAGGRRDWTAAETLKNVVLTLTRPDGEKELLVVGVPGDREVDMKRLSASIFPATAEMFDGFASRPDLVRGYIGPQGPARFRYLADPRVAPGTAWVTGANEPGRHAINVVCGRDFTPDGTIEAADVRAGDPCPSCGAGLSLRRGIEVGHIFALGRRYTDAFEIDVPGPDGAPVRPTMGSYGIGVTRALATIAEQHADARGLVWPASMAPAQVHVVAAGTELIDTAVALAASLEGAGLRVLVDDRAGVSAGVKFTDAELLGSPWSVVVGRRLSDGFVELRERAALTREDIAVEAIVGRLSALLSA